MNVIRILRETHNTPDIVQDRVARAGGSNRFGEPNFRVIWGGSRLTWIGGRWTDYDAHGDKTKEVFELRRVPKYIPTDRWYIERWMPPEFYGSPKQWEERTTEREGLARILALGPYPSRGEYEHCWMLADFDGAFLGLTSTVCDWVVRAVEWSNRQPRAAKRKALETREANRERNWDRVTDDILDESVPAFHAAPFVNGIDSAQSA